MKSQKLLWILTITNAFWLSVVMVILAYFVFFKHPRVEENLRNEYRSGDEAIWSSGGCSCEEYENRLQEFVTQENQKLHDFVNKALGF